MGRYTESNYFPGVGTRKVTTFHAPTLGPWGSYLFMKKTRFRKSHATSTFLNRAGKIKIQKLISVSYVFTIRPTLRKRASNVQDGLKIHRLKGSVQKNLRGIFLDFIQKLSLLAYHCQASNFNFIKGTLYS